VTVIRNETNRGFGAAANQALAACTADYVLLLNADTVPSPGAGAALAAYLDRHPRVALAGPRLLNDDGSPQQSAYPFLTPWRAAVVMSGLNAIVGGRHDRGGAVAWLKGAALAVRRAAVLEVGGFDEGFFMYGEDVELAYRLHEAGWEAHLVPSAAVVHREQASTPGSSARVQLDVCRGVVRLYRLHYPRRRLVALRFVLVALMVARLVRDRLRLLRERDPHARTELRAALDAWRAILLHAFDP
jgi:N-acetylglucosaminyl-diphospho-decaprenol L-rhamnosyltransferase